MTIDGWAEAYPEPLEDGAEEELEARLRDTLATEPLAIQEEFIRVSSDLAYWSARYARAIGTHLRATARRKRLWGLLLIRAREELSLAADEAAELRVCEPDGKVTGKAKPPPKRKEPTVDDVKAHVETFSEWEAAQSDEIASEVERERLKGAVLAVQAKKDMLVQLGASIRAEMERDPVIRQRAHRFQDPM